MRESGEDLVRQAGIRPGLQVLDLGCGVGGMLRQLGEYGQVIGTDVTLRGLEHCAARHFPRLAASSDPAGQSPLPAFSTAMNALCGTSTLPIIFILFLPFFCFSNSLRLRVTSPP